jgi:hypothetical protein
MIYNGITDEGIKAIDSALELSAYEHKKLAQHQKLSSLADEDLAYTIRKNVNYLYIDYHFDNAEKWLSISSQKYDRRKKYAEKDSYDYLVNIIKEAFQVETVNITRLTYEGYDRHTRWIEFTTDSDYVFHMTIPVINKVSVDSLTYVHYGKIALGYYTGKSSIKILGYAYNMSELKSTMDTILTSDDCTKHLSKSEL